MSIDAGTGGATIKGAGAGAGPVLAAAPRVRWDWLLAGLPALGVSVALGAILLIGAPKTLNASYVQEAQRRLQRQDYAGELVCLKRLMLMQPDRDDYRFETVLTLERLGRIDQAETMARALAPTNRTGVPTAHLWLAQRLYIDPTKRTVPRLQEAEGHLLRYLQKVRESDDPKGVLKAKEMLGTVYAMLGRPGEARPYLEASAGNSPDLLLFLAGVYDALGDRPAAESRARAAMEAARRSSESRPDDKNLRLIWAQAAAFLGDYNTALQVLKDGDALTGDAMFRKAMAGIAGMWADRLGKDPSKSGDRLTVIQLGLGFDDTNAGLLNQLGSMMINGKGADADKAREAMQAILAAGRAPALAHLLLGTDAHARGKSDEARAHWEEAYRLSPKTARVANNLAWHLALREPVDLPRALSLIDQGLAQSPNDPLLHGTRGEILVKMGRWKEAVAELEATFEAGYGSPGLHAALATAYDQLGMPEMAAQHRKSP